MTKKVKKVFKKTAKKKSNIKVSLPEKPSERCTEIERYSVLVHGEKKIGKTSLFAQEGKAFFMMFDPEQLALEIYQRQIPDWKHLLAYLDILESKAAAGTLQFTTLVIDGVDIMFNQCFEFCCSKLAIKHPNEVNDYGESWRLISTTFSDVVRRMLCLPGIAPRFICHSKWKETKSRDGDVVEKLVPMLTGQAEEVLVGLIDIWAAYCYDCDDRVLVVQGDEATGAGHRVDHAFRTPTGKPIEEIHMGSSPVEAYKNFKDAFENKQTYISLKDRKEPTKKSFSKKKIVKKKVLKKKVVRRKV